MADTDPPESSRGGDEVDSSPPSPPPPSPRPGKDTRRSRLEGVIPEIIKRAVELGVEKARESPDNLKQFVGDLKVPKEIAHYVFQQVDETKNGLFRVVAKEIRDFLEQTNFGGELQKVLTTVQFEVNTTIRFTPNDGRAARKDGENDGGEGGDENDVDDEAQTKRPSDRAPLPKPEVKTQVHVRRPTDQNGRRGARQS